MMTEFINGNEHGNGQAKPSGRTHKGRGKKVGSPAREILDNLLTDPPARTISDIGTMSKEHHLIPPTSAPLSTTTDTANKTKGRASPPREAASSDDSAEKATDERKAAWGTFDDLLNQGAGQAETLTTLLGRVSNLRLDIRKAAEALIGTVSRIVDRGKALSPEPPRGDGMNVATQTDGLGTDAASNRVYPDNIKPEYSSFKANEALHWPQKTFVRVEEVAGALAEAQEPIQAHGGGETGAGLPGPLTPVPSRTSMGSVSLARGRLPNDDRERQVYTLTYRDGSDRPADQEALFRCLLLLKE